MMFHDLCSRVFKLVKLILVSSRMLFLNGFLPTLLLVSIWATRLMVIKFLILVSISLNRLLAKLKV